MQRGPSIASLYPQARKLQYELKTQLDYLESGRIGQSDQSHVHENLNQLQNLLAQIDGLVNFENASKREIWRKLEHNFEYLSIYVFVYEYNASVCLFMLALGKYNNFMKNVLFFVLRWNDIWLELIEMQSKHENERLF